MRFFMKVFDIGKIHNKAMLQDSLMLASNCGVMFQMREKDEY